jgi:hypothetical protein
MMSKPDPILIGFFPKRTARPDAWFGETSVEEVCSVSDCISTGPEDWINRWKHNMTWWLFDTEEVAWEIVGEDRPAYDMYAYRLFPVVFDGSVVSPVAVEATATGDLSEYDFLGYDPVSREEGISDFGHSPLSCNKGFDQYQVNRFCLLDDLNAAWRITSEIARDAKEKHSWEPGPYYLCEVHRKRK